MDNRSIVRRLLKIGVSACRNDPDAFAMPSDDPDLGSLSAATIATWLEELGRHRLIGDVQPCFTKSGGGFRFQVTNEAMQVASDPDKLDTLLNTIAPQSPVFDVFISYAAGDSAIAVELRDDLERSDLKCFMAEKDIAVASDWQDSIREALIGSKRVLVLLTPRSIDRPWVLTETGAAWALGKKLIPALSQVDADNLPDLVRRYQVRVIETSAQRKSLVSELAAK